LPKIRIMVSIENLNIVLISVYKIRKIATYINKLSIYDGMRSGEDTTKQMSL